MFGSIKARRRARRAKALYDLAVLEGLMAENSRRLAELRRLQECPFERAQNP